MKKILAGVGCMVSLSAPLTLSIAQDAPDAAVSARFSAHTEKNLPYPYLQYLPADYENSTDKVPLLLFLHGAGERGDQLAAVTKNGVPRRVAAGDDFPFILIAPQCPANSWWNADALNKLLDKILAANPRVDRDRVYLTGLSMGGFGTWALGMAQPRKFAALVPICGGGDAGNISAIKRVPVWAFHGAKDTAVKPEESEKLVKALEKIHGRVKFTLYPDAGHDSWTAAYNDPQLYEWLLEQNRGKQ